MAIINKPINDDDPDNQQPLEMTSHGYSPVRVSLNPDDPHYLPKLAVIGAIEAEHEHALGQRDRDASKSGALGQIDSTQPSMPSPERGGPGTMTPLSQPLSGAQPREPRPDSGSYSQAIADESTKRGQAPAVMGSITAPPGMSAGVPVQSEAVPGMGNQPDLQRPTRAQSNAAGRAEYEKMAAAPMSPLGRMDFDRAHPWGSSISEHPGLMGRIGHDAAFAGNVAGDIMAPKTMALIPGTELYKNATERGMLRQQDADAERSLRTAQANEANERAAALKNPKPEPLTGADDTRVNNSTGQREQRYKMADGSIQWAPEGQLPSQQAASQSAPTVGMSSGAGTSQAFLPAQSGGALGSIPQAAPAASAGTAGYTYGNATPKGEEDKFISQYLRDNGLSDTAANRQQGHEQWMQTPKAPPIGNDKATSMNGELPSAVKGFDPKKFAITSNMTQPEAEKQLSDARASESQARANASAERAAGAPAAAEQRKGEHNYGYSTDGDGNVVYTTEAKAAAAGTVFEPVSSSDVHKDRQASMLIGNVQLNASNYRVAEDALPSAISSTHAQAMEHILSDKDLADSFALKALTLGELGSIMSQGERAGDWNKLSKPEQKALNAYLRAQGAVIAYQRALTNQGRTNPEALQIELNTIPRPMEGSTEADARFDSFQQNIDQVSGILPNNLPGVPSVKSIRERAEGKSSSSSTAPKASTKAPKVLKYNQQTGTLE